MADKIASSSSADEASESSPNVSDETKKRRRKRGRGRKIKHYKRGSIGGRKSRSSEARARSISLEQPQVDPPVASEYSGHSITTTESFASTSTPTAPTVSIDTRQSEESILASPLASRIFDSAGVRFVNLSPECQSEVHQILAKATPIAEEESTESQLVNITPVICALNISPGDQSEVNDEHFPVPSPQLIADVVSKLQRRIFAPWLIYPENDGINAILFSRNQARATQRSVFFSFDGKEEEVVVHSKQIPENILKDILDKVDPTRIALDEIHVDEFVERIVTVVKKVQSYEVCVGVDDPKYRFLWDLDKPGKIDENLFFEARYTETFRPFNCDVLVPTNKYLKRRCHVCVRTNSRFTDKFKHHETVKIHSSTANVYLDRDQLIYKVETQQKKLEYARAQIVKLRAELRKCIERDGVGVDEELSDDLCKFMEGLKSNEVKIGVHRDVSVPRSNVLGEKRSLPVSVEPLPKRARNV